MVLRYVCAAVEDQSGGGVVGRCFWDGCEGDVDSWGERRALDPDVPSSFGFVDCPTDLRGGVVLLLSWWSA